MSFINDFAASFREVFSQKKYIFLSVLVFLFLFYFNIFLMNGSLLWNMFSFELLWNLTWGIFVSRTWYSAISMILLSILGGIVLSFVVYLLRRQIQFSGATGFFGILVSVVAPSCSACAIGLLGLLGVGGAIAALPFEGLEINILALGLLLWSIFYLSKKIQTNVCEIPLKK